MNKLVYVPGVRVSGTARVNFANHGAATAKVRVTGPAAAQGTLNFSGGRFGGRLDRRAVHSHTKLSGAGFSPHYPSAATLRRLRAAAALRKR